MFDFLDVYPWLLPVIIFFGRIVDVSLGTLRIIFVSKGEKNKAVCWTHGPPELNIAKLNKTAEQTGWSSLICARSLEDAAGGQAREY